MVGRTNLIKTLGVSVEVFTYEIDVGVARFCVL